MEDTLRLPWLVPVLHTGPDRPESEEHVRIVAAIAPVTLRPRCARCPPIEATLARNLGSLGAR